MKRKVIIIPFVYPTERYNARLLVAKDRASGDWTFFSGTCEPFEVPIRCALRELYEETMGLIRWNRLPPSTRHFRFTETDRRIDVYFIPLSNYSSYRQQKALEQAFDDRTSSCRDNVPREFLENEKIRFLTFKQFQRKTPIWSFILRLMCRPQFTQIMNKINMTPIKNRG